MKIKYHYFNQPYKSFLKTVGNYSYHLFLDFSDRIDEINAQWSK